jgi:hypothetical protein
MKVTGIRTNKGLKLTESELNTLCQTIVTKAAKMGFKTGASIISNGSIKIGLHMQSFRIITSKLGHNARVRRYVDSPKGYKRTNVPTWDQREDFNHLINDILDHWKLSANIKSGPYEVRSKADGRVNNWYPIDGYTGGSPKEVLTETEAREQMNSDELEVEHANKMKPIRREKAKIARENRKLFDQAKRVTVDGFYEWNTPKSKQKNGKLLSHSQFNSLLLKLPNYEARRVRIASIKATADLINNAIPF